MCLKDASSLVKALAAVNASICFFINVNFKVSMQAVPASKRSLAADAAYMVSHLC